MITVDCAVCVIHRDSLYLIAQRKEDDSFGGYWEFPGGKREEGETLEICAAREAREEMGLEIAVHRHLVTVRNPYPEKRIDLHFFLCEIRRGEPQAIECDAWRWVTADELSNILFPPANERVIDMLVRGDHIS